MARYWLAWAGLGLAMSSFFACDIGYTVDDSKFCRLAPNDPYCINLAGSAGAGGFGGAAGAPAQGSGGAPQMGMGGGGGAGGTGGAPPCTDDAAGDGACVASAGDGSLCVAGACTKPGGDCDAKALVVVVHGRAPDDTALAGACYYRDLDAARAAISQATERLALYTESASSTGVLAFTAAATLDGHPSDASKAVALTLPAAASDALVTFAQGGTLRGVALNGGGSAAAVRVTGGALTVLGPTTIANASPAIALVGSVAAQVTGSQAAPVRLSGNQRGVVVPAEATLLMQGDANAESLVIEGTSGGGAAVFFDVGSGAAACSTLSNVTLRDNTGISGTNGTGAVEVRRNRQLVIEGCTFERNRQSVTFSGTGGSGGSSPDAFLNVHLMNNVFTNALPTEPNTGSVLCGTALAASGTNLFLREGNVFPNGQACSDLPANSQATCDDGHVFAHNGPSDMVRTCASGTCQCVSGTAQCGGGT